ncbi:MAG: glycoside hydrolase family 25 protein [Sandaracinaceae bacterium]
MRPRIVALVALALASCVSPVPYPDDGDVGFAEDELVVCGRGPTVEGIDVSYYQNQPNWAAVAGAGIKFAIVRIGDGTFRDPEFARNWSETRANGIIRGAYQFFRPGTDPIVQADIVVSAVGRLGPGDLPVTIDVEAPSPGVSPAVYTQRIHQWVDRVTAGTGKAPIIYTGRYYWDPYVASSDFASSPLWHAQYTTASCPNINDRWNDWAFWQYTSTGRVAGISGNVDRNRWNGTLAELQAFANSNSPPRGFLDAATCSEIRGWAQDPDAADAPIDVHVYIGGPAGSGAPGFPRHADVSRDDLCSTIGSCAHGFSMPLPLSFFDGADHEVYAYGIDSMGGENTLLSGAPITVRCDEAPFPMPAGGVVRRHVPSPDVLAAWHRGFVDVAPLDDAMLDAIEDGPDLSAAPHLVRIEGEDPVYVREHGVLRHVRSPAVMSAWGFSFDDVETITPVDAADDLFGTPWLDAPFLAQGSGPAVYLLDAPPALWAELVDDDVPTRLAAGMATRVTLTLRNRGSVIWVPGAVELAPTPRDEASELCDPSWPSCDRAATIDFEVTPGGETQVQVPLRAPNDEGPISFCFNLVLGTHWFSDEGQNGPADDAMCWTADVVPANEIPTDPTDPTDPMEEVSGDCGCRVGARREHPAWLAILPAIAIVVRRRRRR